MATFLMVHGAWHEGWCFEPLRPLLETHGHTLLAPDLPGVGKRKIPPSEVTLAMWADFVAELARAQAEPVILCGHSRGGIVASEAAERAPEAIRALVYISGFMLSSGQSLTAFLSQLAQNGNVGTHLRPHGDGSASFEPSAAPHVFYNRTPEALAKHAVSRLVPEPMAPFGTPLHLSEANFGRLARHYVECKEDQAIPLAQQRAMQQALPCASVTTLESDHSPFFCCPEILAEALKRIAASE